MDNQNKGIAIYLLIAFGMAWAFWCVPMSLGMTLRSSLYPLILLPGAFAPAIAAIIVRKWVTREGFADAGLRLHFQRNWRYYLIAWLSPLAVVAVIVIIAVVLGLSQPDFSLERFINSIAPGRENLLSSIPLSLRFPLVGIVQGLILAIIATPILWGEEFGWRSYLQIRLLSHRPILAAAATGLIWGVWHYPINLQGYNYPNHRILGLFIFPIWTVLLSVIFGWLRLRTNSIWTASLAHSATNAIGGSLTLLLFMGGQNWIMVGYPGLLSWIPLGVFCIWIIFSGQLKPSQEQQT